jgi:hypothetical protein
VDLFGPYPASAQEREGRVRVVFGDQGPLRQVQMRAVRHRCPGCRSATGDQCTQGRPGGRRRGRSLCHPSRVVVSHPCAEHQVRAGVLCPGEHNLAGVCEKRQEAAAESLQIHAAGVLAAAARRAEQERAEAGTLRTYLRRA